MAENINLKMRVVVRSDSASAWSSVNPQLLNGEIGYETDTLKFKIGDGSNHWKDLKYAGMGLEEVDQAIKAYTEKNLLQDGKIKSDLLPEIQSPVIVYNIIKDIKTTDEASIKAKVAEVSPAKINKGDIFIITTKESETTFDLTGYVVASQPLTNDGDGVWAAVKPLNGNVDADKVILKENITLAGDYEQVGNISKTKEGTATFSTKGMSVADALVKIFSKEIYPSTSSKQGTFSISLTAPSISANHNNNAVVAVGTKVTYNAVTANAYAVSSTKSEVKGFTYGHAAFLNGDITKEAIEKQWSISQTPETAYTLNAEKTGYVEELTYSTATNSDASTCKIESNVLSVALGDNTYKVTETPATATGSIEAIEPLYIASNLNHTEEGHKSERVAEIKGKVANTSAKSSTHKVIGVYPVYTNVSGGENIADATTEIVKNGSVFEVEFKAEDVNYAKFSYPTSHTLTVKIWNDMANAFTEYSTLGADTTTAMKTINGAEYSYSTWVRKGAKKTEPCKYQFTLSKSTSAK